MPEKGYKFKGKDKYIAPKVHVKAGKSTKVDKHTRDGETVKAHTRKGAKSHTRTVYRKRTVTKKK